MRSPILQSSTLTSIERENINYTKVETLKTNINGHMCQRDEESLRTSTSGNWIYKKAGATKVLLSLTMKKKVRKKGRLER